MASTIYPAAITNTINDQQTTKTPEASPGVPESSANSYNDILKSTSIVGGSQAINYVVGLVRTKLIAILLGPSGVGLVSLFQSSITLVGQLTGLGISSSGVRQIAQAHGDKDKEQIGKTVRVLRRACWFTGILGWAVAAIFSRPLSNWAFESADNAWLIAILGAVLLLTAISGGQRAIIQGTRRIADLAWMTVLSSVLSTVVAISIYFALGVDGIIPVLVSTAAITLAVTWWFARRIEIPPAGTISWAETYQEGKELTNLGVAFMWGGVLTALVDMGIRSLIVREIGIEGTGYYQAAWSLSGMFANFILGAMSADFYPRLTGIAKDHVATNTLVNEQIEIGILMAVPGLLVTLAIGPLLIIAFYSSEFVTAAELLPWFVLGIFIRVMSWPVGYIVLAQGSTRWFILAQTSFHAINMLLAFILIRPLGIVGAGISFCLAYCAGLLLNLYITHRLTGFTWSLTVAKLFAYSVVIVLLAFVGAVTLPALYAAILLLPVAAISGVFCARGIANRVGKAHRIIRTLLKFPGMKFLLSQ